MIKWNLLNSGRSIEDERAKELQKFTVWCPILSFASKALF